MSSLGLLHGKRILVTGGAGFIGSNLVRYLLESRQEVRVSDNLSRGSLYNLKDVLDKVAFLNLDLTASNHCVESTKDIDCVFHLASPVGGVQFIRRQNVANLTPALLMHANLLEAARVNDVERFLFASSACVYYERDDRMNLFNEDEAYPANPPTTYGWAKIAGEKLCQAYSNDYGIKTSAVRIFNAYGENENLDPRWSHVIPSLIRKAILYPAEDFVVFGDGTQERAFLYVRDCVDGLARIVEKVEDGSAINLGSREVISIGDLAESILKVSGKKAQVKFDQSGPRGVSRYAANLDLLESRLEWVPQTKLGDGLVKTYDWAQRKLQSEKSAPVELDAESLQL